MADRLRASMRDGARAAMTDPLTGLFNRRYAIPHLERLVARATQTGRGCTVLMADVDHFKPINDSHGHAAGDRVLVELAARLQASLRHGDTLSRIGGEEFLITLPDTNAELAMQTAERLRALIADNPFDLGKGQSRGVTLSFGVAPQTGTTSADRLLERADTALYAAKEKGRNAVVLAEALTRFRPAPQQRFALPPIPPKKVRPRLGQQKG
jgi:two-component system cell cycle response regulator